MCEVGGFFVVDYDVYVGDGVVCVGIFYFGYLVGVMEEWGKENFVLDFLGEVGVFILGLVDLVFDLFCGEFGWYGKVVGVEINLVDLWSFWCVDVLEDDGGVVYFIEREMIDKCVYMEVGEFYGVLKVKVVFWLVWDIVI